MKKKKNKNKEPKRAIKPKRQIGKKVAKTKKRKNAKLGVAKKTISKNKKKNKLKKRKTKKLQKKSRTPFTLGNINPSRGRILVLIISIVFMTTGMIFANIFKNKDEQIAQVAGASVQVEVKKNAKLEKEIRNMVQGYPIEEMTPYIAKQDPQTAAFLVAIAKKESNWGKRKPVLNGQDCYNYWGFRLKSERMGSNGHTCFDSPKEAVEKVASRIDEMLKEDNVDSAKDMIVWKCGYGCKGVEKSKSELKWIKDVNYYYNEFSDYL